MRRSIGALALTSLLCAAHAFAAGINLSWDDCGAAGTAAKAFACDTNIGSSFRLFASFVAPSGIDRLNGCESEAWFEFADAGVPSWWAVHNTGTCRQNSMGMTVSFIAGPFTCRDPWQDRLLAGFDWTMGYLAPNRARFRMTGAMSPDVETAVPAGTESYLYAIVINRAKTVSACAGCAVGTCITLTSVTLDELTDRPGVIKSTLLTSPALRQHVTWQSGYPPCPAATPAVARTWGAVKALYR